MEETSPTEAKDDADWRHPHADEIDELSAQIDAHAGARRTMLLNDLVRTFDAWARFSQTLGGILQNCETNAGTTAAAMRSGGDQKQRASIITPLDQAIIAYAAGIGAVVDQTRNALKLQSASLREAEAHHRNALIDPIPGAAFLTKLRNYVLHYLAAPWGFRFRLNDDNLTGEVLLEPTALLKFDGWTSPAREFIQLQSDGIQLSKLLQPFLTALGDHTTWILEKCANENAPLLDEVNGIIAKKNLLLTGGVTDGSDWEARMAHTVENLERIRKGEPQTDFRTGEPIHRDQ
ncbi:MULTISPECIES: hypothetical protein [Arthrobacter]|uniref:Uncharacterized protein n=1 Tax=Arthrobacter terricola TaxID=2547396 RepID=A0A4R5KCG4_9MICC|nr:MULTISPECIES: hypothetical protein [Arthrobacter]MBT8163048.1 hypothetical protein [Arthrobacter sp. GN70]TDF91750.1 hypothetical protein E1809_19715 [Arthrobacter terricola]